VITKADPERDGMFTAAVGGFAGIGAGGRWLGGGVVDDDAAVGTPAGRFGGAVDDEVAWIADSADEFD
jgi:hypothetical protein